MGATRRLRQVPLAILAVPRGERARSVGGSFASSGSLTVGRAARSCAEGESSGVEKVEVKHFEQARSGAAAGSLASPFWTQKDCDVRAHKQSLPNVNLPADVRHFRGLTLFAQPEQKTPPHRRQW